MIRLLVGLGNPGPEYDLTRHNAGFWWVEAVARELKVSLVPERAHHGLVARANGPDGAVWLLMPQTFMNLSGKAVSSIARFYKIAPDEILVAHDELDLQPGQVKLKFGGGHAGHNGLRDIHAQLGTADYWRLRLGIGHPGVKAEVIHWVLRKPPQEQRLDIDECIDRSVTALPQLLAGQMERAAAKIHTRPQPPKPPKPPRKTASGGETAPGGDPRVSVDGGESGASVDGRKPDTSSGAASSSAPKDGSS